MADQDDDRLLELAAGLRHLAEANQRNEKMLAEFRIVIDTLLTVLAGREQLNEGHLRLFEKLRERAQLASTPRIELDELEPDKYAVDNSEVDCAARMHLCHGRCCSFNIKLSRLDLAEGKLEWNIDRPYYLAKSREGYCVYQQRDSGFCGHYEFRPSTCRSYDCREDRRVWIDFEKMIPAPMPDGLVTLRRKPPTSG